MKTYLSGFSLGALAASLQLNVLFLLLPFVLLYSSLFKQSYFKFILIFSLGMAWVFSNWVWVASSAYPLNMDKHKILMEGEINNLTRQASKVSFDFETSQGKIKASCYRCPLSFHEGEVWSLMLRVKSIASLHNPNRFDYRRWMLSKGYVGSGSVAIQAAENVRRKKADVNLRRSVVTSLSYVDAPIVKALILGDKSALKVEDRRLINLTGISHLFVVSGLHISLMSVLVVWVILFVQRPLLLMHWRLGLKIAIGTGLLCGGGYAWVSGFNTPAVRAFFMLLCGLVVVWGRRNTSALDYWVIALCLVLMFYPLSFIDMGAWLSFGIVLALILGMSGESSFDGYVQDKAGYSAVTDGIPLFLNRYFWPLIKTQWIAFCVGGAILSGFGFHVSIISILLNIVLIPLMAGLIVPMSLLGLMVLMLGDATLLVLSESILNKVLEMVFDLTEFYQGRLVGQLPISEQNRYLFVLMFILMAVPRAIGVFPLVVGLACVLFILPLPRPGFGGFSVMMLDVGQGNSAVIETQTHTILVDTGYGVNERLGMTDYVVLPYLKERGVDQLDMLFLSHDDADHAGGASLLSAMSKRVVRQAVCTEKKWTWDGVDFHQFQAEEYKKGNNGTCLLKVSALEGGSLLFAGDIEKKAERSLLMSHIQDLSASVLMVPHHGSKTSSSEGFISAVNPTYALISAGYQNHFGHPHKAVVRRYEERLVKIYSTASHGAVEVEFSPRQEARIVSTYRPIESI